MLHFELSILAAFGAMICWGIGDFLIQREARKVGDMETMAFIGLIGTIGVSPFIYHEIASAFQPQNLMLLFIIGLVTMAAAMLNFEALRKGKLSVIEVIMEIELPVTVALGFIFFGEMLSPMQTVAILVILAGIMLTAFSREKSKRMKRIEKGVIVGVIAAIFMGALNFLTALGSRQVSPLLVIWMPWLVLTVISFILLFERDGFGTTMRKFARTKRLMVSAGVFDTLAWILFAFAVIDAMLSVTIAITESYPAIALILGIRLNKERIALHQYAGAGLALASSVALGFLI